jgi:hypothetical protein
MGVWEQTGESTYKLNHFALGNQYAPGTLNGVVGDPAGPTRFTESVKVALTATTIQERSRSLRTTPRDRQQNQASPG